jgi:hypothetical protein
MTCYSETVNLTANIDDLQQMFGSADWLTLSQQILTRREPFGKSILYAERNDSQINQFADTSSFPALMESLMTVCHEETHGWDFGAASVDQFSYHMRDDLEIRPTQTYSFFPRSEISTYINDSDTQSYDQTYLTGTQGTYGLIELGDELNAYTNGLACIASVGDKLTSAISARDGMSAHLYYLELYLRRARTAHTDLYNMLKADAEWQRFVRFEWARGHFWHGVRDGDPNLVIADAPIWAKVNDPTNAAEIQMFTGRDPADVACNP